MSAKLHGGDPPGRSGMGKGHRLETGRDEWLTPPEIVEALGPFDLDPCASVDRPWPTAAKHYTIADNGLSQPWDGLVWLNPPYGNQTGKWLARLADHQRGGIALVFARTETRMFFDHVWPATSLLFLEGRLHFHHVTGERASHNAGAPSVLVAYGDEAASRLEGSGIAGRLVTSTAQLGGVARRALDGER